MLLYKVALIALFIDNSYQSVMYILCHISGTICLNVWRAQRPSLQTRMESVTWLFPSEMGKGELLP